MDQEVNLGPADRKSVILQLTKTSPVLVEATWNFMAAMEKTDRFDHCLGFCSFNHK